MSLVRNSFSRRSLEGESLSLLGAVQSSGSFANRCSEQFLVECQEREALQQSDSEISWGEEVNAPRLESENWGSSISSESQSAESRRSSTSSRTSEGVLSEGARVSGAGNDEPDAQTMTLTLGGRSVRLPRVYEIGFCSEKSDAVQQAVLLGPYNDDVIETLQETFEGAKVEYWLGKYRIRMPSSALSEIDHATALATSWQKRDLGRRRLRAFGSSALFDVTGSIHTAGERSRVAPDISITTADRYTEAFAVERFKTKVPKGFIPETCIEIRSEGNGEGELETKSYVMLASGAKECFVVDGLLGKVTHMWIRKASETLASLQQELSQTSMTVRIDSFEDLLEESDRPVGADTSIEVVTVVDSNPRLMRSRQWEDFYLDFTLTKCDALYWMPTAKLMQCTESGLQINKVGGAVKLVPRISGSAQEDLPKLVEDAPDPEYSLDDIAWAEEILVPKAMASRCTAAIRGGDQVQLLEGVIHLDTLNLYDRDGLVPLVEAVKVGDNLAVDLLMREGANPRFPDEYGMTAVVAASALKRKNIMDRLQTPLPTEEEVISALMKSDDIFDMILSEEDLVVEDLKVVMQAAIKARKKIVVEELMDRGVDPNCGFAAENESAIEYLIRESGKEDSESKDLVRFLIQKNVEYDPSEVLHQAKRRRRADWLVC